MGEMIARAMGAFLGDNIETNRLAGMTAAAMDGITGEIKSTDDAGTATWTATFDRREDAELFHWALMSLRMHMTEKLGLNDVNAE